MSEYSQRFANAMIFAKSSEKPMLNSAHFEPLLKILRASLAEKAISGEISTADVAMFNSLTRDQKFRFVDYMSR